MSTPGLDLPAVSRTVVATLPTDELRLSRRWLRFVEDVLVDRPDAIGDLELLQWQMEEAAHEMSRPGPDPLTIVILRHGLAGDSPWTVDQVAMRLGYTRDRIRLVERDFVRRLRRPKYSASIRAGFYSHPPDPATSGDRTLALWAASWDPWGASQGKAGRR